VKGKKKRWRIFNATGKLIAREPN